MYTSEYMLDIITSIFIIIHIGGVSLGIGASTLAVAIFLNAMDDGTVDTSERRLLGVVYITLRTAMVLILLSSVYIAFQAPSIFAERALFTWILIAVLFVNAVIMTKHLLSMKIAPAIQAGTWYTLGIMTTASTFSLFSITLPHFIALYGSCLILATVVLNFYISCLEEKGVCKIK